MVMGSVSRDDWSASGTSDSARICEFFDPISPCPWFAEWNPILYSKLWVVNVEFILRKIKCKNKVNSYDNKVCQIVRLYAYSGNKLAEFSNKHGLHTLYWSLVRLCCLFSSAKKVKVVKYRQLQIEVLKCVKFCTKYIWHNVECRLKCLCHTWRALAGYGWVVPT